MMAKQRKEQAACRANLLEKRFKIQSANFLANQSMNQVPYWEVQQLAMPTMHLNQEVHLAHHQDQSTILQLEKLREHLLLEYPIQDQFYADPLHAPASSSASINTTTTTTVQWPPTEYGINGASLDILQGQANFLAEMDTYFNNLQSFDVAERYLSIDIGNSSTTSPSVESTSWEEMSSIVNIPESKFDTYQKEMLTKVVQ